MVQRAFKAHLEAINDSYDSLLIGLDENGNVFTDDLVEDARNIDKRLAEIALDGVDMAKLRATFVHNDGDSIGIVMERIYERIYAYQELIEPAAAS